MLKKINQMILEARKGGEKFKAKTLSLVKAELIYNDKSKKPMKEMQVVQGYAKRLEKASHAFKKTDKYNGLVLEMEIVGELIPKAMPRAQAKEIVERYFSQSSEDELKDFKPGVAISALKETYGDHNGQVIVPEVMMYLKK